MGRKEELKALNTPIDGKHYRFVLGDGGFTFAEYDVTLSGLIPIDEQFAWYFNYFTEVQYVNDNIQLAITALSTMEDIYNQVIADDLYTTLNGLDYLYVTHLLGVMHVKVRINPYITHEEFGAYSDTNPVTLGAATFTGGNYQLKFAPDGWEDDEYQMNRNMQLFGVFRKYAVGELKFVKDGRDYLAAIYEATGVNSNCTLTVYETPPSGIERVRFTGRIDFSTYKITELSVDVQVIDGSFTDLVLSRMATTVNLMALKSIDGETIPALTPAQIKLPDITIIQVASWQAHDTTEILDQNHSLQVDVVNSEYPEAQSTAGLIGGKLFEDATENYPDTTILIKIEAEANGNNGSAHFTWVFHLDRWSGGIVVEADLWSMSFESTGSFPMLISLDDQLTFDIFTGDSLVLRAEIINDVGTGDIQYSVIDIKLSTVISDIVWRNFYGILYHEAFDRIVQIITGDSGLVKSNFVGRTDIGYANDGTALGTITTGRYLRQLYGMNNTIPVSLDSLFKSLQSIYCLGIGVETIEGVEKVVIEEMSHFFDANVIINVSDRIASETIIKEYYPELAYNRVSVGFNSFDYRSIGGIYEFNTTSKYTTCIKPVDRELQIVSPLRADMSGVITIISETSENKDVSGEEDVFILDTIRDGFNWIVRTSEGFDLAEDLSNRDTLFNVILSPARSLIRWGSYLRGFLEKYLTSLLIWQTSDKNTKLKSKETGLSEVVENANILTSDLSSPLWHPEIFTLEIPALENDINLINENPYGLIQITTTEYGWILSYKSKNENGKSEFTLLRCNTDYVTPIGNPVYPATVTIKKTVTGATVDYTTFAVSMVGDNGVSYVAMPIVNGESGQIVLTNVPYGTYTITENAETGYTLTSITPSTFTLDRDNLHFDIEIVNSKDPVIETIKYGALYNFHAVVDARSIAASGWEVPEQADFVTLKTYLGGGTVAGGKLKDIDSEYWNSPNTDADNSSLFNGRGAGYRGGGAFTAIKNDGRFYTRSESGVLGISSILYYNSATYFTSGSGSKDIGLSVRLIKTTTTLSDGETGTYSGNDGKVYRTICIGTQEWLADNLNETKYRNGDLIPVVTDNATWAALTTGARCSYNNDNSNL